MEIFDRKFKMAKDECTDIRGALRRLEGVDFVQQIEDANSILEEKNSKLKKNISTCKKIERSISKNQKKVLSLTEKIESAPAEIIDPVKIKMEREIRVKNIERIHSEN